MTRHSTRFFDSHAHIDKSSFGNEIDEVIQRAIKEDIEYIINIGSSSDPSLWDEVIEISKKYSFIKFSLGVHPHNAKDATLCLYEKLYSYIKKNHPVAIGETGLDNYYDFSPLKVQEKTFRKQIDIAKKVNLPIIIHCRDAHELCIKIIEEEKANEIGGVVHCFSTNLNIAEKYLDYGFYISIPGIITFKKSEELRESVKKIPIEMMLIETDSPYLAPKPFRGKRNEPAFIKWTAEEIAKIKNLSIEDVARITSINAKNLFKIDNFNYEPKITYAIRNSLYLNITNKCNLHCTFCGKWRNWMVKGHYLKIPKEPSCEEIINALKKENFEKYREVVFCGYGEPTLRIDVIKEVSFYLKDKGVKRIRINTDGLANLVHQRDILPELKGLIDTLSVSFNAENPENYVQYCRSKYGEKAYYEVLNFIKRAKELSFEVIATVVELPQIDVQKCKKIAEDRGAIFKLRHYDDIG